MVAAAAPVNEAAELEVEVVPSVGAGSGGNLGQVVATRSVGSPFTWLDTGAR